MNQTVKEIFEGVLEGEAQTVQQKVKEALEAGLGPEEILKDGLIAAMAEVGRRFEAGEYYVPEMLISARAMQGGTAILKPYLQETQVKSAGKVALGTVRGDLHDIGKNLVGMMLEGAGFEIQDLGTDVSPDKFVNAVRAGGVDVIAMSALLTTTMPHMKATLEALTAAGLRSQVKVIVGGAPLTPSYAQQIGADGYAEDASRAVTLVKSLLG